MQSLRVALVALVMASASAFIAHTPARSAWTAARPTASRTAVELQSAVVEDIMDKLKGLTLLEASELVKEIEDTFGVDASAGGGGMMMAMPAAAGGGDAAADAGEEQTEFDIMLTDVPADKKIAILKVVRTITGLGLKEAKDMVEKAPVQIKEAASKEDVDSIKAQIEEASGRKSIFLQKKKETMCGDSCNDWARENNLLPKMMALVGGLLCGIGWFLFVDGTAVGIQLENKGGIGEDGTTHKIASYSWLPAFFATAAFIMLNTIPWNRLNADETEYHGTHVALKTRLFLIGSFLIAIIGLTVAIYIFAARYILDDQPSVNTTTSGVMLLVSNLVILIGAFVMRAATCCTPSDPFA